MRPARPPSGPLTEHTLHLCIDMQRLFSQDGPWHTPWMTRVLPVVARLSERFPERTVFTRFIPPVTPEQVPGTWRQYFERWRDITREHVDPALLRLMPPLQVLVPPAQVIDKAAYSVFSNPAFLRHLRARKADGLIVTGTEMDVCVLATVLDAIDHGYHVTLVTDGICSSSDACHEALLTLYRERFSIQLDLAESAQVLDAWR
jgi:nicotinamidase-related amidase